MVMIMVLVDRDDDRTAYSAAFVAVGALGMAFGPFFSAVMNGVEFEIAGIAFNGLTNPGWIMFIFWIVMGLIIHFEFQVYYMPGIHDVIFFFALPIYHTSPFFFSISLLFVVVAQIRAHVAGLPPPSPLRFSWWSLANQ